MQIPVQQNWGSLRSCISSELPLDADAADFLSILKTEIQKKFLEVETLGFFSAGPS